MDSRISARVLTKALGGWRTREPAYEALADGIRLLCLDGRVAAATALPAERELATALGLSRTTVATAYRSLRETGHITSLRGSGSITQPVGRRPPGRVDASPGAIDLQQASPSAWPGLAGIIAEVAADAAALVARPGYDLTGDPDLRRAIADRYTERGLATTAEQILVTAGAQAGIDLVADTLLRRGDRAVIETPTYPHAAESLRAAGARLVGVPVSCEDGWDLDRAVQAFERSEPAMAYLMPAFQNPTGRTMTDAEQVRISVAAARAGAVVVVDDTTAELALDDAARPDLTLPSAEVRIGSLGKIVWGGLRIGWVRTDPETIRLLVAARPRRDLGTPDFEQAVAARLLRRMPEILVQRAGLLRDGRDALAAALRTRLPEWQIPDVHGGVALWVGLDAPLSGPLVLAARDEGIYLSAGGRFGIDGGHEARLRVPFTAPPADLTRAVEVLAELWPDIRARAPRVEVDMLDAVV